MSNTTVLTRPVLTRPVLTRPVLTRPELTRPGPSGPEPEALEPVAGSQPTPYERPEPAPRRARFFAGDAPVRLFVAAVGSVPVSLIAVSTFGVWGLRELALVILLSALVALAVVARRSPLARRLVARGVRRGIVATLGYDLFRWSFLWFGWMQVDPIPHIGSALGLAPAWGFGYLWRYLGNGGGLAIAFTALGLRGVRAGMVFGLAVCAGLLATLVVAPFGQEMLFPLNPTTIVMATVGHLIYGAILGALADRDAS